MPRGDKSAYTGKQKRQAEHIEQSEKARGMSPKRAAAIGWATVNKQDGGGRKAAGARSSRGKSASRSAPSASRSAAAKKGWATRRRNARG